MPVNTTRRGSSIGQTSTSLANVQSHVSSTLASIDELGDQNEEMVPLPSSITQMPCDSVVTLQTLGPSFLDDLSTVEDFFSDDNGQRLLPDKSSLHEASALGSPLTRVPSIDSMSLMLSRVWTRQSTFSVETVVNDDSVRELKLEELCRVVDRHRSMQCAQVVSAGGYKEWTGTVVHRYLVLELRRDGRKTIWLRIDRRRSREVKTLTFLANGATTPANDVAKLSATKNKLIVNGQLETVQTFTAKPTLGDLRHLFRVIRDELQQYQLWPANCWFFVSLLHQHLEVTGDGVFLRGSLPKPKLAQSIRETVKQRMCLLYRIPDPVTLAMNLGVVIEFSHYTRVDDCYRQAITQHVDPTNVHSLNYFRSITSGILCAQQLWTVVQLVQVLFNNDPGTQGHQRNITRLALLFTGTHKLDITIKKPHSSFTDFLSDPARSGPFSIDIQAANREMALACLRIVQSELHFNICRPPTSFKKNQDLKNVYDPRLCISPQVLYACQHLIHHVTRLTTIDEVIIEGISILFREQILSWLEVMSVTSSPFVAALRLLSDWVKQVSPVSEVAALIDDAMKFVQTFKEPITQSAAHIYLSALSFAPTHSKIHEHYFHLFPGINVFLRGRVSTWADLDLPKREMVCSVAISPDGTHIVSGSRDGGVWLWNARTGTKVGQPMRGHTDWVTSVAFSLDGTQIVSGSDDHTLRLWDAKTGASIGNPLQGHTSWVRSVAFSPDGTQIVSGSSDGTLRLWDAKTGASIGKQLRGHTGWVMSVAFSPDGAQIVSGSDDRSLRLWDAKTGASIGNPLRGHTGWVRSVAFSPDGAQIVSGSDDHTLRLWDARTGACIGKPLQGHTGWVRSVAFSPDGARIVSGSDDHTLRLWDAKTGASIGKPMRGHTGVVLSVAFSPDSARIVSGSGDHTLRLWDAKTGASIGNPLRGHPDWVNSVAFSPVGTQVVSGSEGGTIRLWNVTTGDDRQRAMRLSESTALDHDNLPPIDLQYPPELFPLRHMYISEDGWIHGPNDELIIWIPPVHRPRPKNSYSHCFIVGVPHHDTEPDFRHCKCGEEWAQCRDPTPTPTLPTTWDI